MAIDRVTDQALIWVAALFFTASVAVTVDWCSSMSAMGEMPMPGGWAMSMMWMGMAGQTWFDSAAAFLGMWVVMTVAMMLPSLVPMLSRYRHAVGETTQAPLGRLTCLVALGYFFVWGLFGVPVFAMGIWLAGIEMRLPTVARAVPIAAGVVVLFAGVFQFTPWKACQLTCCREAPGSVGSSPANVDAAWRHGLYLGLHCALCCAGLMATLLVIGVMDLRAMAIVGIAITIERLATAGDRAAKVIGAATVISGLFLMVRAGRLG